MNSTRKCLWPNVLLRLSLMAVCILLIGSVASVLQLEEANAAMPSGEYGKDWGIQREKNVCSAIASIPQVSMLNGIKVSMGKEA